MQLPFFLHSQQQQQQQQQQHPYIQELTKVMMTSRETPSCGKGKADTVAAATRDLLIKLVMTCCGKTRRGGKGAADVTKRQKQDDAFAMLTDDALLTPIFEFVGLFEYRFVAVLNKRFRRLYSEFQKRKIHPTAMDSSLQPQYFPTSLTSTTSVAQSIERAKLLMSDMNTKGSHHFMKLCKCNGDETSFGSLYDLKELETISGAGEIQIKLFLRDKVVLKYVNLELQEWARANGCPWNEWTCAHAAGNGHLEILQWARANDCPWNEWTCAQAASKGHLEMLQWARAEGCPWNAWTCAYAARNGHLEMLQCARADGCPWDELTCAYAASNGHLEVLQWARANGCPWNEATCSFASRKGQLEVLQWARANGCPE